MNNGNDNDNNDNNKKIYTHTPNFGSIATFLKTSPKFSYLLICNKFGL